MRYRQRRRVIALVGATMCAACGGNMTNVLKEKQDGAASAEVYPVSADRAWQISETILRWEGAGPIEEHRDGRYMLTTIHNPAAGSGQDPNVYVGIWIEPAHDGVKVSCAVSGPSLFSPFHEPDFHARFHQALTYVENAQPLPITAPPLPAGTNR